MTTKTKKRNKLVWVTRDMPQPMATPRGHSIWWSGRPRKTADGYWLNPVYAGQCGTAMSGRLFNRVFGLRLKPGECKRVRLSVEVVDE